MTFKSYHLLELKSNLYLAENRKKAVLPITKGMKTTKDPPKKIDDSRKENRK